MLVLNAPITTNPITVQELPPIPDLVRFGDDFVKVLDICEVENCTEHYMESVVEGCIIKTGFDTEWHCDVEIIGRHMRTPIRRLWLPMWVLEEIN